MDDYTMKVGQHTYRLRGTQLDVVRMSARMDDRWHRGLPTTIDTTEGEVTLPPPDVLTTGYVVIDGPWQYLGDNPWSTPGLPDDAH